METQQSLANYNAAQSPVMQQRSYRTTIISLLWLIVIGNAVEIVWLWVHGGNITTVHNLGDFFTSTGRLTGLLGAYVALIQVLLLARLPWLERLAGFDKLTVWHRLNGKICLYLVLAHAILITIGYAAMDRISIPKEVSALLSNYTGMVAATVGTVLMVVVVISSLVIARRRLRYETWYVVHLTVYAGIALAWVHQIPTGNELTADPNAAAYWTALYIITAALLVLFRIVQPIIGLFRYRLRVSEVISEGPGVVSLRITGRNLRNLNAHAGQFFLWRFLTPDRWWAAHPFSLSEAPNGRSLRITVKNVGDFTSRIGQIPPGTAVIAEGPFGVFTAVARQRDRVALIAGGIGITPIRSLLEEMTGDLVLLYRVIHEEELVFRDELDALARDRGITLHYVVGDHRTPEGARLMTSEHIRSLVPDIAEREIFICGPPLMMELAEKSVRLAGTPPRYIHTERFAL